MVLSSKALRNMARETETFSSIFCKSRWISERFSLARCVSAMNAESILARIGPCTVSILERIKFNSAGVVLAIDETLFDSILERINFNVRSRVTTLLESAVVRR